MIRVARRAVGTAGFLAVAMTLAVSHGAAGAQGGGGAKAATESTGPGGAPKVWGSDFAALRQPYVDQARQSYPAAKARFEAGLPAGHRFFVVADFQEDRLHENAFLKVGKISKGLITAVVASRLERLKTPRVGDEIVLSEAEILDWVIVSPDGKEEGNFIGKFLDEYSRTHR